MHLLVVCISAGQFLAFCSRKVPGQKSSALFFIISIVFASICLSGRHFVCVFNWYFHIFGALCMRSYVVCACPDQYSGISLQRGGQGEKCVCHLLPTLIWHLHVFARPGTLCMHFLHYYLLSVRLCVCMFTQSLRVRNVISRSSLWGVGQGEQGVRTFLCISRSIRLYAHVWKTFVYIFT